LIFSEEFVLVKAAAPKARSTASFGLIPSSSFQSALSKTVFPSRAISSVQA
jgi:hypothetical protein